MKNLKKVFALLVVFTMVLSTVAFASPYDDVKDDADYAEAVTTLSSLGLFKGDDQGNFNPDKGITRAEFAAVVVRTMGMGDPGTTTTSFIDVPATHWGSGYIQAATQMGILAGYGDGNFGPDDQVTYEQAIKMIVAALGYTPEANQRGGYPTGYMMIAAREGITSGANGKVGEEAVRSTVAQLLYNALDVPLMVQTGFGTEVSYEVMDGKNGRDLQTLLSEKLDVVKIEGVITENYLTKDIGARKDNKKVKIEITRVNDMRIADYQYDIDDVEDTPDILVGDTNAKDYLGYTVVAYVSEFDTSDATIISIAPRTGKNQTIVITDMENVVTASASSDEIISDGLFRYWIDKDEDDDAEEVEISSEYEYYVNGLKGSGDPERPESGKIVLLDNNDDDEYDYIFVTNYEYVVVDEVDEGSVASKTSVDVDFDDDDDDLEYVIYLDGDKISWEDLEEWDVLSIVRATSSGKTHITAYVTRDFVSGIVTEDLTDDALKYVIDGKEMTISSDVEGDIVIPSGSEITSNIKLGNEYTFYLNVDGKVVYVERGTEQSRGSENYAYLYNAAKKSGLNNTFEVELFTKDGEWVVYETADKFYVNDVRKDTTDDIEHLFEFDGDVFDTDCRQLVSYKLDSNGKIRDIDSSLITKSSSTYDDDDYISIDDEESDAVYKKSTNRLDSYYIVDSTVIFAINNDGNDKEDYEIVTVEAFVDGDSYRAEFYDVEANREVPAIVAYGVTGAITQDSEFFVVKSVAEARNEDDDVVYIFRGLQGGEDVTLTVSEEVYITRIEDDGNGIYVDDEWSRSDSQIKNMKGYVIQYSTDSNDEVNKIRVVYAKDNNLYAGAFKGEVDEVKSDMVLYYGLVTSKKSGRLTINEIGTGDDLEEIDAVQVSGANFVEVDFAYDRINKAGMSDVDTYESLVIVREFEGAVEDVVIINGIDIE